MRFARVFTRSSKHNSTHLSSRQQDELDGARRAAEAEAEQRWSAQGR